MSKYAIAFDIDTARMRADGYADPTFVYKEVARALAVCGFTEHVQGSLYSTSGANNPIAAVVALRSTLHERAPVFCRYASCVHVFRLEEWSDITYTLGEPVAPANANATRQLTLDLPEEAKKAG